MPGPFASLSCVHTASGNMIQRNPLECVKKNGGLFGHCIKFKCLVLSDLWTRALYSEGAWLWGGCWLAGKVVSLRLPECVFFFCQPERFAVKLLENPGSLWFVMMREMVMISLSEFLSLCQGVCIWVCVCVCVFGCVCVCNRCHWIRFWGDCHCVGWGKRGAVVLRR